jgi:hypothetical protein
MSVTYDPAKTGLLTPEAIAAVVQANQNLGLFAPAVQTMIDASLVNSGIANKVDKGSSLTNLVGPLPADAITDPATGLTVTQALAAIRASIIAQGASPPTITTDPTVAFPGGTGDPNETFTITAGTIGGGANTGTTYQIVVNGNPEGLPQASLTGTLLLAWFTGTRQFRVIQIVSWANGPDVQRTSPTYTLNTPAAVPVLLTPPTWGNGTPTIGTTLSVNNGSWTNTPLSRIKTIYKGWVSALNKGTALTAPAVSTVTISNASPAVVTWTTHGRITDDPVVFTTTGGLPTGLTAGNTYYVISAGLAANTFEVAATIGGAAINTSSAGSGTHTATGDINRYTIQSGDAGATLVIGEVAKNAAGFSSEEFSTPIIVAGGAAPQWVDANNVTLDGAVLPSWTVPIALVGDTLILDLGETIGNVNPSGYAYQLLRDDSSVGMPSGANVSAVSYPVQSIDNGHVIAATLTASNASGTSRPVTVPGVDINGTGGGGGTGGVLSGSANSAAWDTLYTVSSIGTTDWAAFPTLVANRERKSGGPDRITAAVTSGVEIDGSANSWIGTRVSWVSGTPTGSNTISGASMIQVGAGSTYTITITGMGTTQESIGIILSQHASDNIQITASLSDGSAPNWTSNTTPGNNLLVSLSAKAGSSSQTLTVVCVNVTGTYFALSGVTIA